MEPGFQFLEDERVNIFHIKALQGINVEDNFDEVDVEADSGGDTEVDEVDRQTL